HTHTHTLHSNMLRLPCLQNIFSQVFPYVPPTFRPMKEEYNNVWTTNSERADLGAVTSLSLSINYSLFLFELTNTAPFPTLPHTPSHTRTHTTNCHHSHPHTAVLLF